MISVSVGALITLTVGLMGVINAGKINEMINQMYDDNLVPIADVANANMQAIYLNRSLYDFAVSEKEEREEIGLC